jgi:hypothetical protein
MNPFPFSEGRRPGETSPMLFTDRTDCVYLSFGCFYSRSFFSSSARDTPCAVIVGPPLFTSFGTDPLVGPMLWCFERGCVSNVPRASFPASPSAPMILSCDPPSIRKTRNSVGPHHLHSGAPFSKSHKRVQVCNYFADTRTSTPSPGKHPPSGSVCHTSEDSVT